MSVFTKTTSISNFASQNGITGIDLIKNPNTGKIFGKASNDTTFRVSDKVSVLSMDLQVSWFTPENGEPSWLIHPEGQENKVSSLSFGTPAISLPKAEVVTPTVKVIADAPF